MGRLAEMAKRHYQEHLPTRYAAIPATARPAFFQQIEEEAEEQIDVLADSLAGEDPPGETFEDHRARLTVARQLAEHQVIRETVLPAPTLEPTPVDEDPEMQRAFQDFQDARAEFLTQQ